MLTGAAARSESKAKEETLELALKEPGLGKGQVQELQKALDAEREISLLTDALYEVLFIYSSKKNVPIDGVNDGPTVQRTNRVASSPRPRPRWNNTRQRPRNSSTRLTLRLPNW